MTVEQLPSDEVIVMTEEFHRIFNAVGCNPKCHCCYNKITPGDKFKLASVRKVTPNLSSSSNSHISLNRYDDDVVKALEENIKSENINDVTLEVMLCSTCTSEDYKNKEIQYYKQGAKAYSEHKKSGAGCFRVNGKIVTEI